MKTAQAHLRSLRIAPRKVRLVVDAVRGLDVGRAEQVLTFEPKIAARPVLKLLKSAIANAKQNHQMEPNRLFVESITANDGPTLKRFRPRAMGASAPIRKRTTHISITLAERPEVQKKETKKVKNSDQKQEIQKEEKAAPFTEKKA